MSINRELGYKVIDFCENLPPGKRFEMGVWGELITGELHCNTSACFAGWVTARVNPNAWKSYLDHEISSISDDSPYSIAKKALNLSYIQADWLFYRGSTIEDVRKNFDTLCWEEDHGYDEDRRAPR